MHRMRWASVTMSFATLAVVLGGVSLWVSHGPSRVAEFTPWLAAGVVCVGCGLWARRVASWSLEGPLLVVTGFLWLLPDVRLVSTWSPCRTAAWRWSHPRQ